MDPAELRTAVARLQEAARRDPRAAARALKGARAARYARPRVLDERGDEEALHLEFLVGGERLAVPAAEVVALTRVGLLNALPLAPPHVIGVVAFRGQPVLVVALHALQGGRPPQLREEARLVVVRWAGEAVAILADRVVGVRAAGREGLRELEDPGWIPPGAAGGLTEDGVVVLNLGGLSQQLPRGGSPRGRR